MSSGVRIGIDASSWANRRGYGRYTRELVRAILDVDPNNDYTLFLDAATEQQCPDLPERPRRVVIPTSDAASHAASAEGHRSLTDMWAMTRAVSARSANIDLFYFPTVYTFFPVARRLKPLVTIHDTIAERHPALIFPRRRNRILWSLKVAWAVRQASLLLTVSDTARSELINHFSLGPDRVRVVSDAVGPEFQPINNQPETDRILVHHGLDSSMRFLLYLGGISPHKSLETLVEAFCSLIREDKTGDLRLVLAGDFKGDVFYSSHASLRQRVTERGAEDRVIFAGFVPDVELPHWLGAAQALVMPSVDEGFGLPALEAMACGTPVVVSRAGALPEVVGDAGLLFEPRSAESLAAELRRLLADESLQKSLSARGLARAAQFSWRASARAAIEVFEEVARAGRDQSQSA